MNSHTARRVAWVLSLVATALVSAPALAGSADILWVHGTRGGYLDSSPVIADLDGDGSPDIGIASIAGPVFVLDGHGREIWKTDLKEPISVAPTAADVSGDPALELLVLTQAGRLYCLEGRSGDVIWADDIPSGTKLDRVPNASHQFTDESPIRYAGTTIVAADIDADGRVEIVTNTAKTLICLDWKGNLLWKYAAGEALPCAPAVGDLNGDGTAEIITGSFAYPAIALSATGKVLWKHARNPALPSVGRNADVTSPVIADLDNDGRGEVITFDQNTMTTLNADGSVRWTTVASRQKVDASITVADADRDGSPEIYVVDISGDVTRVNADGKRIWTKNIGGRCRRSFSVADVDGDGVIEIVVGAYTGKIHILTPDGMLKEELAIGAGTNATSSVADLLGDKSMCVVTPEITGNLSVYHWKHGTSDPVILVPGYRGGNARTASAFVSRVKPGRLFQSLTTGSPHERRPAFTANLLNPAQDKLTVALTVADDNGIAAKAAKTVSDQSGRVTLRYDGAKLSGTARFTCTVSKPTGIVEQHTFTYPLFPYTATVGALAKQDRHVESLLSHLPDRKGIDERHTWLRVKLPGLVEQVKALPRLSPIQRRELRDNLRKLADQFAAVETLAATAAKTGTRVRLSAANPWAPFGGIDELAEGRMGSDHLRAEAFHGEVESAALNVWNFSGTMRTLRVTIRPLVNGAVTIGDAITVREVVSVATQMADMAADALPRLNEAHTVDVPAWGARQLWLEIHTNRLSSGQWKGTISLKDMDVSAEVAAAPLTVSVWPVAQSTKDLFRLCGWADTRQKGVLEDMFSHGMNVFTDAAAVPFTFAADGHIVTADFSTLDSYMNTHARRGIAMFHSLVQLTGPAKPFTPVWKKAYVSAVRQFTAHIRKIGFDYADYTFYPVDEPGIEEGRNVARFMQIAPITHQADPRIRIYANPAGITQQWLAQMIPYVDIYAPMHISSWDHDPELAMRMREMRADAEEMWTYTCAHNAKHQSPLAYYRAQMWMCFSHGHTGGGFYTYSRDVSGGTEKFWHMRNGEYALVYPGRDGPVPSKRWEAVRDGTEDYSMLMALKAASAAPGADPALVKRAQALMAGVAMTIGNYCSNDADGTTPGKGGPRATRKIADRRWRTITAARREVRDLLKAFERKKEESGDK